MKRFWYLRRSQDAVRAEVDEEIAFHLEMRIKELRAEGRSLEEARREALRQFGDVDAARTYCRDQSEHKEADMQRSLLRQDVMQDVRVSLRSLRRAPVFAATVVLTVGLGIGATTLIFAAVNAALLRPLPYQDPDRLVWIYTDTPPFMFRFSAVDYLALQAQQTQFESIAGFTDRSMSFSDGSSAELLRGRGVSWSYFGVLGLQPALGRDFVEADGQVGKPPVVIVSHAFWQQRLGARADALGTRLTLDGADYELVGVLPAATGPLERRQDFFVPLQIRPPTRRGPFSYWMVGRLRDGVDAASAASELRAINKQVFPLWRSSYQDDRATWSLIDLKERLIGGYRTTGAVALAAVALVWLIACANAANLLIARVAGRRQELSVRAALGASRARVIRHLLVESALLVIGAAAIGAAVLLAGLPLVRGLGATYFPRMSEVVVDGPVVLTAAMLTIASVVLFGLIPALHGVERRRDDGLHVSGRTTGGGQASRRLRRALVGAQFAVATPLLIAASLLLLSLQALRNVDLGFDTRTVLSGSIRLPASLYPSPDNTIVYWNELDARLRALPGVSGVAWSDSRPPNMTSNINNFDLEDAPTPAGQSQPATAFVAVSPEFFTVLGLALIEGRLLEPVDATRDALRAVVVDRAWAARFFPNTSAVGKRFKQGGCTECPWTSVVGVVSSITLEGLDQPNRGTVYYPLQPSFSRFAVVRTSGDPSNLLGVVQRVVRELDATVPITDVGTMAMLVDQSLEQPRALSFLVAGFAILAVLLSVVGIYGVMAHYVQQHAKEISIRLALGGSARRVLAGVVGEGLWVALVGVALGMIAAAGLTQLMATLLFGVGARDAAAYAGVGTALLAMALLACVLPARRAVNAQPATVLRTD